MVSNKILVKMPIFIILHYLVPIRKISKASKQARYVVCFFVVRMYTVVLFVFSDFACNDLIIIILLGFVCVCDDTFAMLSIIFYQHFA